MNLEQIILTEPIQVSEIKVGCIYFYEQSNAFELCLSIKQMRDARGVFEYKWFDLTEMKIFDTGIEGKQTGMYFVC